MKDELGDRMKSYEVATDYTIQPGVKYFILRLDGIGFHSFASKLFIYPFDSRLRNALVECAKLILERFSGALLGYIQSDEMSLLFKVLDGPETKPLYNNRIQRLSTVAAGLVSGLFNRILFREGICNVEIPYGLKPPFHLDTPNNVIGFDCRCFTLPEHEINNYFVWRQKDCHRNSTNSAIISLLKQEGKSTKEITRITNNMTTSVKWKYIKEFFNCTPDDYPLEFILGTLITRQTIEKRVDQKQQTVIRHKWKEMLETPDFVEEKEFVENLLKEN